MKKTLTLSLVILAFLLAACGGQPAVTESPTRPEATLESATATLEATSAPTAEPVQIATESPVGQVNFSTDILPVLQSRCVNCHGGDRTEEGLVMLTYANLMAGSNNGVVIIPGDAANSLTVKLVLENKMPKRGPKLTPAQVQFLIDWINQGALDN